MTNIPPTPPPLPQPPPAPSPGPVGPAAAGYPPVRQSFGEQAARFSVYAPLVVILLGCFSRGGDEAGVATAIGWINLGLIVAGFAIGMAALVSMRIYGRERILARALVGVLVNGLLLASVATFLLPAYSARRVRQQVVGHWQFDSRAATNAPPARTHMELAGDGTFRLTRDDGGGRVVASVSGGWRLDRNRTLGIEVRRVEVGDPSGVGQKIGIGTVKRVDGNQMVLTTDSGEEVFQRLP